MAVHRLGNVHGWRWTETAAYNRHNPRLGLKLFWSSRCRTLGERHRVRPVPSNPAMRHAGIPKREPAVQTTPFLIPLGNINNLGLQRVISTVGQGRAHKQYSTSTLAFICQHLRPCVLNRLLVKVSEYQTCGAAIDGIPLLLVVPGIGCTERSVNRCISHSLPLGHLSED